MYYKLKFPVTLEDPDGKTRTAVASEITLSIDCTGYSQTIYPRDKAEESGTAIWFANKAIYVAKMFPNWCPQPYPTCRATQPVESRTDGFYDVYLHWVADKAYVTHISFYLNEDGTITVV